MSTNPYYQKQAALARKVVIVKTKRVEGDDHTFQARRNAIAMMRAFVSAFPDEAVKIIRELVPEVVK